MSRNRILLAVFAITVTTIPAWGQQPFAVVKSRLADIYAMPGDNAARQTQALYGEVVDILQNRPDGWTSVSLHWQKRSNGGTLAPVIGWTRTTNLTIPPGKTREEFTRNMAILYNPAKGMWVPLYERAQDGLRFVDICPEGTLLPITRKSESEMTVLLADGREGVVSASNVRMLADNRSHADFAASLLFHAQKYIGRPVISGGLGPDGIDGSGLVHLTSRIAGRLLPRDEAGISDALRAKDKTALVTGDVIMLQHAFSGQPGTALFAGPGEGIGATGTNIMKFSLDDRTWLTTTWRGFPDARSPDIITVTRVTTNVTTIVATNAVTHQTNTGAGSATDPGLAFATNTRPGDTTDAGSGHTNGAIIIDRSSTRTDTKLDPRTDDPDGHTSITNSDIWIDRSDRADLRTTTPSTNGPAMYSIHLGSMLVAENAVRLLQAIKHTSLPVFVTVRETSQGQFLSVHAGWFADFASARQAHAANLLIQRVAPQAAVRAVPGSVLPWSAGMRLYSVQVMSLKNPHIAMATMRDLARLGLGPVLRYIPLSDGNFWSVIHCDISTDRARTQQRVLDLTRRSRWKPILSYFP
ncbi:MAG TPA: hypothetical protein PLM00_01180 [Spirochaetota bacterium]|nr:hypothetical protein [Spirochaetota bacterium]HPN81970.1 hypothetical protein [Spirochaetota bacterium]